MVPPDMEMKEKKREERIRSSSVASFCLQHTKEVWRTLLFL